MKRLTTEQLLRIVSENKEVKPDRYAHTNDVHRFIAALNIKPGKHEITQKLLYKSYRLWSDKPKTQKAFTMRFSTYFLFHIEGRHRFYKLNYRPIELMNKVDNGKVRF